MLINNWVWQLENELSGYLCAADRHVINRTEVICLKNIAACLNRKREILGGAVSNADAETNGVFVLVK